MRLEQQKKKMVQIPQVKHWMVSSNGKKNVFSSSYLCIVAFFFFKQLQPWSNFHYVKSQSAS